MFTIFPYCHVQFNRVIHKVTEESVPFDEQSLIDLSKLVGKGLICDAKLLSECEPNKFPENTAAN